MRLNAEINRRHFMRATADATDITLVPRHVLGGPHHVAPSNKITIGFNELPGRNYRVGRE
ncbi:hypothetical protein GF406_08740 [candidate division KSB1 bacterium]|nr:hypothetical protein [candidate division KSB1 bacterium]